MAKETKTSSEEVIEKVKFFIDPKRTNGGLWTNGKREVGWITCTQEEAEDKQRRRNN